MPTWSYCFWSVTQGDLKHDHPSDPVKQLPNLTTLLTHFIGARLPHLPFSCMAIRLGGSFRYIVISQLLDQVQFSQGRDSLLVDSGFQMTPEVISRNSETSLSQGFRLIFRKVHISLTLGNLIVVGTSPVTNPESVSLFSS